MSALARYHINGLVFFAIWTPLQLLSGAVFVLAFLILQTCVLPFRLFGGTLLAEVLALASSAMYSIVSLVVMIDVCEPCYGRDMRRATGNTDSDHAGSGRFDSFDHFLHNCSPSRRKNIKRNLKKAGEELEKNGIEVVYKSAGSWRITRELRTLIWDHAHRRHSRNTAAVTDSQEYFKV